MPSRSTKTQYSKKLTDCEGDDSYDLTPADLEGGSEEDTDEVIEALDVGDVEAPAPAADKPPRTDAAKERSIKVTEPVDDWSIKVTSEPPKPLSIKVTGRKRRSDKKDKQALDVIRKFVMPTPVADSTSFSSDLSPPFSPPPSDTKPLPSTDTKPASDTPTLCVWDLTQDLMKLAAATIALQVFCDQPTSWTFNLTPDAEKLALVHPKGFVRSIVLAFNRALQRRFGFVPLYWLSLDSNKFGRVHLHGAIALGPDDDLALLQGVMREAWGPWTGRGKEFQIDLNPQRCDDGWAEYAIRNRGKVRTIIGSDHTFYIPDELRARGEWCYGEMRSVVR